MRHAKKKKKNHRGFTTSQATRSLCCLRPLEPCTNSPVPVQLSRNGATLHDLSVAWTFGAVYCLCTNQSNRRFSRAVLLGNPCEKNPEAASVEFSWLVPRRMRIKPRKVFLSNSLEFGGNIMVLHAPFTEKSSFQRAT